MLLLLLVVDLPFVAMNHQKTLHRCRHSPDQLKCLLKIEQPNEGWTLIQSFQAIRIPEEMDTAQGGNLIIIMFTFYRPDINLIAAITKPRFPLRPPPADGPKIMRSGLGFWEEN